MAFLHVSVSGYGRGSLCFPSWSLRKASDRPNLALVPFAKAVLISPDAVRSVPLGERKVSCDISPRFSGFAYGR